MQQILFKMNREAKGMSLKLGGILATYEASAVREM